MYLNRVINRGDEENESQLLIGQWRKANHIHNWFVQNVQNGVDDCDEYQVSLLDLKSLEIDCMNALKRKNPNILPPVDGFFFGSTEIDDYYWSEIKRTIEIIREAQENGFTDFNYQSSW